jgi:hypothetical protein
MGVNMQPSFPTGAAMDKNYIAPAFCGDEGADKNNKTFISCMQTLEEPQSCCCTNKKGPLKPCTAWSCCKSGTTCAKGACV